MTDHEAEYIAHCPACGDPIDYCQGHGIIGDPSGARILALHDDGSHVHCDPAGCDEAGERPEAPQSFRSLVASPGIRFLGDAIETRYLGPTNYRGARIVATCYQERIVVPYPHERGQGADAHSVAAYALLERMGLSGPLAAASTSAGYVFVRV